MDKDPQTLDDYALMLSFVEQLALRLYPQTLDDYALVLSCLNYENKLDIPQTLDDYALVLSQKITYDNANFPSDTWWLCAGALKISKEWFK